MNVLDTLGARRARLLVVLGAILLPILLGVPAQARAPQSATDASASAPPREHAPEDPWQRGTPRGALRSFLESSREGRWEDAAQVLDLSHVPPGERAAQGPDLARKLKFLLDEDLWIDLAQVSDEALGATDDGFPEGRDVVGDFAAKAGAIALALDRVPREDGVRVWRVASSTLQRVPSAYAVLGPPAIVEGLPKVLLDTRFLEVALWQWIGLMGLVLAAWVLAWIVTAILVHVLRPLTLRSSTDIDDRLLAMALGPVKLLLTIGMFNAGLHLLRLSVPASGTIRDISKVLVVVAAAWLVLRVIDLFATIGKERFAGRGQAGAAHLVPLGARAVKVAVVLLTFLATLDTFGFDVTALLAGLGVGGLAVALAAQKTVENVFGGITVLVDQPVRPGDFCKFGDKVGTVEDVGLRSTRIRTLDRTVISVPNAEFSNLQLENFAKRDRIRLITTLGLRYETSPDQMRHVLAGLRRVLLAHPKVLPEPLRVRLAAFGAYSLDVEVLAYVDTQDINEFIAVREDLFLRFMDVLAASGTGFAFPSSTTYLARDGGLDGARKAAAEAEIARLRDEGRLMFPDYAPEDVRAMDDTLDWPPRGSVAAAR
ncbi:MAG: mechanosensitive ion channel family protein [Planctomycetes bacterium]|nr:mechanosensitive ion channel family protein [Planctomycetota bacterium]